MKKMVDISRFKLHGSMFLVLIFSILVFALFYNAFYAHPMADDYCFAVKAHTFSNWIDATFDWYQSWGGRYTAWALASLFPLNFDLVADYWIVCVCLIFLTLLSFYLFFFSISFITGLHKDWMLWALFSFCVYIALIPALPEVLYWMAGGISYTGGYCLLLITLGLLIRLTFKSPSALSRIYCLFVCGVLVLIAAGLSEIVALLQSMLIALGAVISMKKRHHSRFVWIFLFMLSIVGLVAVVGAPGNTIRAAQFEEGGSWTAPFYALYGSVKVIVSTMVVMLVATTNSTMYPLLQRLSGAMQKNVKLLSKQEYYLMLLSIFLVYFTVFFVSYWATGGGPADRTKGIFYILPLVLWIPCVALMRTFCETWNRVEAWLSRHRSKVNTLAGITLIAFLVSMNLKNILVDIVWRAEQYDQQLTQRYIEIENAKQTGNLNLTVEKLENAPQSMFFGDILPDPMHWRNQCYKNYYHLDSIKTES
jgi:hypothetical protein